MSPAARPAAASTLHRRIRADLEQQILSGLWPPGHRIPSELELCARYDCARMTVNKVLTELAGAGMIERRRRAGSFVRRPEHRSAVLDIHDIRAEVETLGLAYRFEILARRQRRATPADRAWLARTGDGPAGAAGPAATAAPAELLALTVRHFAGATPFCIEDRLIDLVAVPAARDARFDDLPPGTWLRAHVPWSSAEHRIRAEPAGDTEAALLAVTPGSACLVVERQTWHGGRALTLVRFVYPGAGHELVARFSPSMVMARTTTAKEPG